MPKLYPLPIADIRSPIHKTVLAYANAKISRNQMNCAISGLFKAYGITELALDNYRIRIIDDPITTRLGVFPVVVMESDAVAQGPTCPVCGNTSPGYLGGDTVIAAACLDCGTFYQYEAREVGRP
jgi:hypothetical protein